MMAPSMKRAKTEFGKADDSPTSGYLVLIQDTFASLLHDVENFRGDNEIIDQMKTNMLKLKSTQRHLYDRLSQQKAQLEHFGSDREKVLRDVAARGYEQAYLKAEISRCRSFKMSSLENIAIDEVLDVTLDQALLNYLNNGNVRNPKEKTSILASLHKQLEARGMLESQLKRKEQEFNQITREIRLKRDFLNSLPGHLHAIDRASQPLMKFMSKSSNGDILNQKMTGKERLLRLETARSLSPPLYTLFSLLQHYIDRIENNPIDNQSNEAIHSSWSKITIKVVAADKKADEHLVTLQLPVPDYTSASLSTGSASCKRVSIQFRYYPMVPVITACATGCGTTLNQDMLLEEMFPGDTSEAASQLLSVKLKNVQISDVTESNPISTPLLGISYQWCNVLAGLYQVPLMDENSSDVKETILVRSTQVVANELIRRVRANAILKYCIQALKRNIIPSPPHDNSHVAYFGWKLTNFTLLECQSNDSFKYVKDYEAIFRNDAEELKATVSIHHAKYPSVPPRWIIHLNPMERDGGSLFYSSIKQIESTVNFGLTRQSNGIDSASSFTSDMFSDWLLVYQIREIINQWNNLLDESTRIVFDATQVRKVRGRDHSSL